MCLIFFSYDIHKKYGLVLAANRDEFYGRPTKALDFWDDMPHILGGRDLKGNGTWMGITRTGRFAAITNYRDPASLRAEAPSRGWLVRDFLMGKASPENYLDSVQASGNKYNGFNLLVGDGGELFYYSNRGRDIEKIKPGLHGLSNHLLDTPWPKVENGKAEFEKLMSEDEISTQAVFHLLSNRDYPPDDRLPDTGMGLEWERILSPLFVDSEIYGTRSSSLLLMERNGKVSFLERTFAPESRGNAEAHETRTFAFSICGAYS